MIDSGAWGEFWFLLFVCALQVLVFVIVGASYLVLAYLDRRERRGSVSVARRRQLGRPCMPGELACEAR